MARQRNRDSTRVPLVVTYHPSLPPLTTITQKHHSLLHLSDRLKKAFPTPPIIAFRRPRNLRDLLVRADLSPPARTSPGNSACGRPRCKTCSTLLTTNTFTSKTTGRSYQMKCSATCKSSNVIYLIQCRKCGCQYVGETEQALNERMNSHRTDIRHKADKPVAIHFNTPGHTLEDLQVMVIEKLWRNDSVFRKIRENRWISSLATAWPNGMNLRIDSL